MKDYGLHHNKYEKQIICNIYIYYLILVIKRIKNKLNFSKQIQEIFIPLYNKLNQIIFKITFKSNKKKINKT